MTFGTFTTELSQVSLGSATVVRSLEELHAGGGGPSSSLGPAEHAAGCHRRADVGVSKLSVRKDYGADIWLQMMYSIRGERERKWKREHQREGR